MGWVSGMISSAVSNISLPFTQLIYQLNGWPVEGTEINVKDEKEIFERVSSP
jgi:3-methyladenine DNA glycosylase AlkC